MGVGIVMRTREIGMGVVDVRLSWSMRATKEKHGSLYEPVNSINIL